MVTVCIAPLVWSTAYGDLTIGGVDMLGPAWAVLDLSPLRESLEVRQTSVLIEGRGGRRSRPGLPDETDYSLRMAFSGATDQAGVPWADPRGGLLANRRTFETSVIVAARATSDGTLPAVLSEPDPATPGDSIDFGCDLMPLRLTGWQVRPNGYGIGVLEVRISDPDGWVAL